ncbi:hypothetical protein DSUL_130016 [Desulfovibrionales bacterium]
MPNSTNFNKFYISLEVSALFHQDISGIMDIDLVVGFIIVAKAGIFISMHSSSICYPV